MLLNQSLSTGNYKQRQDTAAKNTDKLAVFAPHLSAQTHKLRVVLISTLPPVNTSLSEYGKFLVENLLEQNSEQMNLHVLADRAPEAVQEMDLEGLSVERCWDFNDKLTPVKLAQRVKALQPDIVLFNTQFASFGNQKVAAMMGLSSIALIRKMGFKVITILHNLPEAMNLDAPYYSRNRLDKFLIQKGTQMATQLILQSNKVVVTLEKYRDILVEKYKADNVEVIGLGSYIPPAKELNFVEENRFLTFGKFGTYKRLEGVLNSFERLSQDYPDVELVIGGADHPSTPGYMAEMERRYAHLKNVHFIGWIEDEDLPQRLQASKAVILSYESTAGSSGPLHLALSQGKAVIAPDFGDFSLVAQQEGAGVLFYEHGSSEAFEEQLRNVIEDKVNLRAISQHNLKIAKLHSHDKIARHYSNLIYSLLEERQMEGHLQMQMQY